MKLLQIAFLLLNLSCFGSQPYIIQAQTRSCQNVLPVTWSCYVHAMCGWLVCDIFYSDNSAVRVCTQDPAKQTKQVCQ